MTVAYENGRYIYVMYEDKCMLVYDTKDQYKDKIHAGDVISEITGTFSFYNGNPQISNPVLGETSPPEVRNLSRKKSASPTSVLTCCLTM